jgi:anti-sigma B factor antagonist
MDEPRQASTVVQLAIPEIVTLPVEVDIGNAGNIQAELTAALHSGPLVLIADMSMTEFCDSCGIRCLLEASDRAAAAGGELRVVIPSSAVRRTMHVIGADQVLRLYPDLGAAMTGTPGTRGW